MKKIISIFLDDIKSVTQNMIVFVVIIGIAVLPALYAWFNIASNWDPYSSTGGLAFAVCSNDKGYTYKSLKVNAGEKIISGLKQNDKMGWDFVDEETAKKGVEDGTYYAAVIIPESFSENLMSVTTGKFEQAELSYYVNEKKNAIAPKITDKGIEAIQESIDSAYVSTLAETIAATLNLTSDELNGSKDELAEKFVNALNDAKLDIGTFDTSVDLLITTIDSINGLVKTNQELLPGIEKTLSSTGEVTSDIKTTVNSTKDISEQITSSLSSIIDSSNAYMESASQKVDEAIAEVDSNSEEAANKLAEVKTINEKIIAVNSSEIAILEKIQSTLGVDCSRVINKLKSVNDKQNAMISKIDESCSDIRSTGTLLEERKTELDSLISDADSDVSSVRDEFASLKENIDAAIDKSLSSMDNITEFTQSLSAGLTQLDGTFNTASTTLESLKAALSDLKNYFDNLNSRIDRIIERVEEVKNDNLIESIVLPIIEAPKALGTFLAEPVTYSTNRIHPIENYGSAMSPFYSSLGFWVGGIVLAAVLNVELSKKQKERLNNPNTTQTFFGRYLTVFFIGQIQALIIGLGDLFFLKIQCESPLLFLFTCLVSSFVYTLIIYSLTITFSVIGKASAVIILVIQIAGSGGTFPIEVLPAPFKTLSPYMPFKYGINALRETIAGVDTSAYLRNLGTLLLFIIPALFLGLFLRKPCIKIISFFNEKVEKSDLII